MRQYKQTSSGGTVLFCWRSLVSPEAKCMQTSKEGDERSTSFADSKTNKIIFSVTLSTKYNNVSVLESGYLQLS